MRNHGANVHYVNSDIGRLATNATSSLVNKKKIALLLPYIYCYATAVMLLPYMLKTATLLSFSSQGLFSFGKFEYSVVYVIM